jgi:hypothetical protein
MKRKKGFMFKISFILLIVFTQYQNILSQTPNFFPLAIGNEYQFTNWEYPYPPIYSFVKIERDTIYPNGKKYYHLPSPFDFQDCRVDSNGNILSISKPFFSNGEPEEYLIFKANAKFGEVWPVAWNYNVVIDTGYAKCIYDDSGYVFGELRKVKGVLIYDASYPFYWFWLAEGIGLVRFRYDDGTVCYLNYAKINGVVYGELVSVDEEIPSVPTEFDVSQNYPNPFNGKTNIQVHLPSHSNVLRIKLLIYNLLGSKVYEGEYITSSPFTIRLDADELNLCSGTYSYSIIYNNKQITKKFLLLK